jgi:hypothetical protein
MRLAEGAFCAAAAAAAAACCTALGLAGAWTLFPAPLLIGAAGLAARRRDLRPLSSACLAAGVSLCAGGMAAGLSRPLMCAGSMAWLCMWDLDALCRATRRIAERPADRAAARRMEASHLARLLLVCAAGAALCAAALLIRVRLGFGLLLLAGTALTAGLAGLVRALGKPDGGAS